MEIPATPHPPAVRPDPQFGPQARYDYDLTLDPAQRTLVGSGQITVTNHQAAPLSEVYLRMWAATEAVASVAAVTVDGAPSAAALEGSVLRVPLPHPLAAGQQARIGMQLIAQAPLQPSRFGTIPLGSEPKFGIDTPGQTLLFGNTLPTVAVRDTHGWNLDPDVLYGEPFSTTSADWRVRLRAPADQVISHSGTDAATPGPTGYVDHDISAPNVRDLFLGAGSSLTATQGTVDGTTIRVLSTPDRVPGAPALLDAAKQALHFFNGRLGPYGYPTLDILDVDQFEAGGMEYPNAVVVTGSNHYGTIHEIAHQWFYGLVGNNEYRNPWLDESLTEFATQQAVAELPGLADPSFGHAHGHPPRLGPATLRGRDVTSTVGQLQRGIDITGPDPTKAQFRTATQARDLYTKALYQQGPHVLTQLRRHIGADTFDAGLRRYVANHRHGIATTRSFIDTMNAASGRDLYPWFTEHRILADEPGRNAQLDPNGPTSQPTT